MLTVAPEMVMVEHDVVPVLDTGEELKIVIPLPTPSKVPENESPEIEPVATFSTVMVKKAESPSLIVVWSKPNVTTGGLHALEAARVKLALPHRFHDPVVKKAPGVAVPPPVNCFDMENPIAAPLLTSLA
jgi:hypothetical protein